MDEDIKIVEEFIDGFRAMSNNGELVGGFCGGSTYIRENTFQAIENLLSRLKTAESENEISDQLIERQDLEIDYLKKYLKEAERMNDILIEVICNNTVPKDECKECIKEWARKKVEENADI